MAEMVRIFYEALYLPPCTPMYPGILGTYAATDNETSLATNSLPTACPKTAEKKNQEPKNQEQTLSSNRLASVPGASL